MDEEYFITLNVSYEGEKKIEMIQFNQEDYNQNRKNAGYICEIEGNLMRLQSIMLTKQTIVKANISYVHAINHLMGFFYKCAFKVQSKTTEPARQKKLSSVSHFKRGYNLQVSLLEKFRIQKQIDIIQLKF